LAGEQGRRRQRVPSALFRRSPRLDKRTMVRLDPQRVDLLREHDPGRARAHLVFGDHCAGRWRARRLSRRQRGVARHDGDAGLEYRAEVDRRDSVSPVTQATASRWSTPGASRPRSRRSTVVPALSYLGPRRNYTMTVPSPVRAGSSPPSAASFPVIANAGRRTIIGLQRQATPSPRPRPSLPPPILPAQHLGHPFAMHSSRPGIERDPQPARRRNFPHQIPLSLNAAGIESRASPAILSRLALPGLSALCGVPCPPLRPQAPGPV